MIKMLNNSNFLECLLHYFQMNKKCLYICQSVSLLTSLMKWNKCMDISCFGWHICVKFFKTFRRFLVHYFQIVINFLFVCQSVSWLKSLLKLGQYRDISYPGWYIFWKFWDTFLGCFHIISNWTQISYISVSPLVGLFPYYDIIW